MKKIRKLWQFIDATITLICARNMYLWRWWMIVSNPCTYIILAIFFVVLYLLH